MEDERLNLNPAEEALLKKVLRRIARNPSLIDDNNELKSLVTKIYKTAKKEKQKANRLRKKQEDLDIKSQTYIFQRNDENSVLLPHPSTIQKTIDSHLNKPCRCYICKDLFSEVHFFYHQLCCSCGDFNYEKRTLNTDLTGRIVLVTGGRVKIGFELVLKMLQDGATVIVTTRFPKDALQRFLNEKDSDVWENRLFVYGLDLRNLPAVEAFVQQLYNDFRHLDIIINNAAQTVKRPLAFYQHLLDKETTTYLLEAKKETNDLVKYNPYFPIGKLDKDLQQIDLREKNSWTTKLNEVTSVEMLEVQLVNNIAPFLLNSQLKKLMLDSPFERKFIINVSAMEGQFSKKFKTPFHPHTNMGKAALNMMTRTSGEDYARDNIFMNSVDTGWVTDENPHPKKTNLRETGFVTPLDIVDGAMRVYAPIADGLNKTQTPVYGKFLKDYYSVNW